MRPSMIAAAIVCAAAMMAGPTGRAATSPANSAAAATQELVILEAPNCTYCAVFRRDVLPRYLQSQHAGDLPIRFVDLNDPAADQLKLAASITQVPTAVLLRRGSEAGRITGYWGPEAFFKGIAELLRAAR